MLLDRKLALLARDILDWNARINLVSRVETGRRLAALIRQCRAGWDLARDDQGQSPWFDSCLYVDLGSGAGLPGLVWALLREQAGHDGATILVEPRKRRAWFLRRAARRLDLPGVGVLAARWGEVGLPVAGSGIHDVMFSLKALRLDDRQILDGVVTAVSCTGQGTTVPARVVILRFLAPRGGPWGVERTQGARPRGGDRPGLPGPGALYGGYRLDEARVLGAGNPRLAMTCYRDTGRL